MKTDYTTLITEVATRYRLDAAFLEAQVIVESSGRTDAFRFEPGYWERYLKGKTEWTTLPARRVSSSYGLLQIMYPTAKGLGFNGPPELLFVPEVGLDWGAHYLRTLLDWTEGDLFKALVAYNGGKGAALKSPFPAQPNEYAERVFHIKAGLS